MYRLTLLLATLLLSACVTNVQFEDKKRQPPQPEQQSIVFPPPPEQPRVYFERSFYTSADVIHISPEQALRMDLRNERIVVEGFNKPFGIAVHQGRVFVSDTVRRLVLVFDFAQNHYFTIGDGRGPAEIRMPLGLDVDAQGNVYVVDSTAKSVKVYNRDGDYLKTIAKPEGGQKWFNLPAGIAVDPNGQRIYVVDTGGVHSQEHRIRVFAVQSGQHLFDIGSRGKAQGKFNLPRDVAVAPDGSIYVVDGGNFRVQQFSAEGQFIRTFGRAGRQSGQFSRPKEIDLDAQGRVYVSDAAFGNFQIFTPDGQVLLAVGGRSYQDQPARFMLPAGIAVDEDGRIYMVGQYFKKVEVYRPAGLAPDQGYFALGKQF